MAFWFGHDECQLWRWRGNCGIGSKFVVRKGDSVQLWSHDIGWVLGTGASADVYEALKSALGFFPCICTSLTAVVINSLLFTFVRPFVHPCTFVIPAGERKDPTIAHPGTDYTRFISTGQEELRIIRSSTPLCRQILGTKNITSEEGTSTTRNRVSETRPATISIYDEPSLSLPPRPPLLCSSEFAVILFVCFVS